MSAGPVRPEDDPRFPDADLIDAYLEGEASVEEAESIRELMLESEKFRSMMVQLVRQRREAERVEIVPEPLPRTLRERIAKIARDNSAWRPQEPTLMEKLRSFLSGLSPAPVAGFAVAAALILLVVPRLTRSPDLEWSPEGMIPNGAFLQVRGFEKVTRSPEIAAEARIAAQLEVLQQITRDEESRLVPHESAPIDFGRPTVPRELTVHWRERGESRSRDVQIEIPTDAAEITAWRVTVPGLALESAPLQWGVRIGPPSDRPDDPYVLVLTYETAGQHEAARGISVGFPTSRDR